MPVWPWMSRADRRRWRAARTLGDLGELMAAWLEGRIASWPGYAPNYGPDDETTELIPTLAACCRAGFLTIGSQPGEIEAGPDGRTWEQRAAVEGFVTDPHLLEQLLDAARRAGLLVFAHRLYAAGEHPKGEIVTVWGGDPHTGFGVHLDPGELALMWPGLHRDALRSVHEATQLTLIDPAYGLNDLLWPTLRRVLAAHQELEQKDGAQQ
ncbi:hypothetical protein G5C51_31705 [Streptomyces sp. A7024]|uniref:DUF6919 domain-containing protein n=1 Tax=Streptomyces coryli TaxID=1128680 RepID=A0A6G4U9P8_9ACTN|nr:hypothetical protein [Streptomyces coryli]NGN68450.1 hypothetical protein [Streptomyces coryli]